MPEVMLTDISNSSTPDYYRIIGENTIRPYVVAYKNENYLSDVALNFIRIAHEVFQKNYTNI